MPFPPAERLHARTGSWPPVSLRLPPPVVRSQSEQHDAELSEVDADPLTYFLTPAPDAEEDDIDVDFDMIFDAGIEDAKHPPPFVRSISPSNLGGLVRQASPRLLTPPQTPTPPSRLSPDLDLGGSSVDEDADDQEDYIRFAPSNRFGIGLPFSLRDYTERTGAARSASPVSPLSVNTASRTGNRGRPLHSLAPRPPPRPLLARSFSGPKSPLHSWREPSPDVWSIQEETDEALNADKAGYKPSSVGDGQRARPIDIPAAKPKKTVRFNLTPETI
jgi:hypothetical protein